MDIRKNALLLSDNLISLLIWVSLWSLSEMLIQKYSSKEKHLYMWYIILFLIGCILLLTLGYPSNTYAIENTTPVRDT